MPREVEKLACKVKGEGMKAEGDKEARRQKDKVERSKEQETASRLAATVFDMRGQTVSTQVNVAGDYVVGGAATLAASSTDAVGRSAVVRELMLAAFDDGELATLCFDHFRSVYELFSSGMSKPDKVQRLIEHCERHNQLEALLRQVEKRNPAKYDEFAARLA